MVGGCSDALGTDTPVEVAVKLAESLMREPITKSDRGRQGILHPPIISDLCTAIEHDLQFIEPRHSTSCRARATTRGQQRAPGVYCDHRV
jgi:hypothetical protein